MVVTRDDRPRYLDALEVADEGELRSLVSFLVYIQKRTLIETMQSAAESREIHSVDEAIVAANRVLLSFGEESEPAVWLKTKETAELLMNLAYTRLQEIVVRLRAEIVQTRAAFSFEAERYPHNIIDAYDLPYRPNRADYEQSCALWIREKTSLTSLADVQAHAIGSKFRCLIGFIVCFRHASRDVEFASREPFQVNYAEPYENAERRFRPWLEESLVNALTLWRKSL